MLPFDRFQRASFYAAILTFFEKLVNEERPPYEITAFFESLGVELPDFSGEDLKQASEYLKMFRASIVRLDISPVAREHLPSHIRLFMESHGYTAAEPFDGIISMTAFAARLAIDAYTAHLTDGDKALELERTLHRFNKTHLIPALANTKPQNQKLHQAIQEMARLVAADSGVLLKRLTQV
ncbi:MAG: hypothetical protein QXG69_01490 [Candidatus Caldarchaeum sp.]|uniref:Uncharacterized protein n=1 Tax=Caldiarchaeum subterraneum TaxID=311458 RepID=A0A7C5Q795_CALS0